MRRPPDPGGEPRAQYEHLADLASRRNVTVHVLPFEAGFSGGQAGARGGMNLVETARHERLVCIETGDESLLISDPAKVSIYSRRYAKIRAQALGPRESLGLIRQLAGERK
ncbi:Scr1 family TA system antitoxin-like transcriptional regulator [Streptomyces lavendulae]|uniref:Scr1 family TA system antitoxin-like transcriptional regulator n=1 Tax=Streptomyces lavendulae TaxID=1914 RepID=UPI0033C9F6DE